MSGVSRELSALVERTVEGLGYEFVDVERAGRGLLRVTIDTLTSETHVTVDDCAQVSNQLTHLFAVEDVDYDRLEVSSPGLDRPLRKAADYVRFSGEEVQVHLFAPVKGRKRWRGRILGLAGDAGQELVQLELSADEDGPAVRRVVHGKKKTKSAKRADVNVMAERVEFALADIEKARIVPTLDFRSKQ